MVLIPLFIADKADKVYGENMVYATIEKKLVLLIAEMQEDIDHNRVEEIVV